MKTKHYIVDKSMDNKMLNEVTQAIQQGELVAIPTETVYGLAANAFDEQAVQKIYHAKGRPSDNPLIVHVAEISQMSEFVSAIPLQVQQLMTVFWPGPITFILPLKPKSVAASVNAGLSTIAVRMPQHSVAQQIIKAAGVPLAAPSANSSGKPSPTTAIHVLNDLSDKIHAVIDAGHVDVGLESTVLDCTRQPMVIVRPGAITQTMLQNVLKAPVVYETNLTMSKPIAPGMKYQHYAPHQPLTIVESTKDQFKQFIYQKSQQAKIGVLSFDEDELDFEGVVTYTIAQNAEDIHQASQQLYDALRYFDQTDCESLFIRQFIKSDNAMALHNRLSKAANHNYIKLS